MPAYLVLPIAIAGLIAALAGLRGGAFLILTAALLEAVLGGRGVSFTIAVETVALVLAFWMIGAYLASSEPFPFWDGRQFLPLAGALAGGLAGAMLGGLAFVPLSMAGAVLLSVIAVLSRRPVSGWALFLAPLRLLSLMVAAYWLMFHLT